MARNIGIDWDAQPLGKVYNSTLAEQLGCDRSAVCHAMKRRGIASLISRRKWTDEEDALLFRMWGEYGRVAICRRLGRTYKSIQNRANRHGLNRADAGKYHLKTAAAILGYNPGTVMAAANRCGVRPRRNGRHYWFQPEQLERIATELMGELLVEVD